MIDPELAALAVSVILGSGGASHIGSRSAFNGIYKRLDRHETKIDFVAEKVSNVGERIAKLEGKNE